MALNHRSEGEARMVLTMRNSQKKRSTEGGGVSGSEKSRVGGGGRTESH